MKKLLRSVLVRSLCVLTLGILLVVYSGQVSRWLVMACGVLFILPGVLAVLSGIRSRGRRETSLIYPLVGIGSILFGTVQLIFPHLFFEALHYVLAIALLCLWCNFTAFGKCTVSAFLPAGFAYCCLSFV